MAETYIESIITMIWTAAVIAENGHCHTFLHQRIVDKVFEAIQLLDPEVFELNYIELAQVLLFLFHTLAYNLDSYSPEELEEFEGQFKLITTFCLDAIYRREITREDVKVTDNGNLLVDGFDFFCEDDSFVDMHELLSTLEVIDSFYQDELDTWITAYDKCDVVVQYLV